MKSTFYNTFLAKLFVALVLLMVWAPSNFAQGLEKEDPPTRGMAFGILAHSFGFGFDLQYHLIRNNSSLIISAGLASYKDPRESKIESAYADQGGKRYIFDKKNYAYIFAPTLGYSKNWIKNSRESRIGVSTTFSAGPALMFLKPYYLEVAIPISGNQAFVEIDKYDASLYNYTNIVGEADYFLGLNEMSIQPGVRSKISTMIDFAASPNLIRGIELSVFADYFTSPLELFDLNDNRSLWLGGSVEFLIGNTW